MIICVALQDYPMPLTGWPEGRSFKLKGILARRKAVVVMSDILAPVLAQAPIGVSLLLICTN